MTLFKNHLYNANRDVIIPNLFDVSMYLDINSSSHKTNVILETLGCKLNQAETELLQKELENMGCRIVSPREKADIYILNTCTVTHIADRKSRHLLRMARRENPDARIVATGCYAGQFKGERSAIEGVDLLIDNKDKLELPQILIQKGYIKTGKITGIQRCVNRTRSFIKVQDGCNNFCSYCIVPFVRGREKSLLPKDIIREIKSRTSEGYREVVLTGTEIGSYRSGKLDLQGLVERILGQTEIDRLRLSSLQPQELSPQLIRLWRDTRICRHFHLALQSGSDSVLQRMGRQYSTRDYLEAVSYLRAAIPGVAITTDIITGFPGETEKEFKEGFEFCRRMRFARMHIFSYSARKNTRAAKMPGQIDSLVKKKRSDVMLELAKNSRCEYNSGFIGANLPVLFERKAEGVWEGLTDNYIRIYVNNSGDLTNRILPVHLLGLKKDGVAGMIPV